MRYRRAAPRLRPGFGAEASGARGGPPAAGTPGAAAAVLKCIRLGGLNQRREPKKKRASSQGWCRLCAAAVGLTTSFSKTCPSAPAEIHLCCSTVPLPSPCGTPCPDSTLLLPRSLSPLLQPDSSLAGRILQVTPKSSEHLRWASVFHPMQQTGSR